MIDDARELPDGSTLDADLCIVGAGAAGITLALELLDAGLEVLLLESGGLAAEADTQALYAGTAADARLHSPPDRYRQRRFGGSTTIWGGRCVPFDPIDFEARSWIPHSGWPLRHEDLLRHYGRANRLCEAGEFAYTAASALSTPRRPMIRGLVSGRVTSDTLERFSCPTDFGARYAHRLRAARTLRVLLHANVTALHLDPGGSRLERLTVRTLTGVTLGVRARRVVLAAGGLEVARLLLASRDVQPHGVGNDRDVVGRYYMCHLAGTLGTVTVAGGPDAVWHGYDVADDGTYCRQRLALTPDTQRAQHIGNVIARLHHPRIADPAHRTGFLSLLYLARAWIPYEYARRLDDGDRPGAGRWLRHALNVLADPWNTLASAWRLLRGRRFADRKFPSLIVEPRTHRYSLDVHAEQQPNPASRVTLGPGVDALGQPQLHVDWRYTRRDVETVQRALAVFAQSLEQSGAGRFLYNPQEVETEITRYGAYGGHHLGTARMGTDPATSVTDAEGRVHGIANLYVAGSALFPTSSQANPTLTLVALALRLARHLQVLHGRDRLDGVAAAWQVAAPNVVPIRARARA